MRIAVLTHDSATFGEFIRIDAITAGLRDQGHHVDLIVIDRARAVRLLRATFIPFASVKLWLLVRRLGLPRSKQMAKVWTKCILGAFYLIPVLREGGYEILLAETHYTGLCAWLMRSHLAARFYVDFHGTAEEVAATRGLYRQAFRLEGLLVRECDFAVSCSATMRRHLIEAHGGDPARHIACHNGTEPRRQVARYQLPLRVIFAGLFAYYQRVMDFVEAARLNTDPEIEFYLMGGGGDETEILDYIAEHRIRIHWLGYRPRGETLDVFTTMQIGVSPATKDLARQVASPLKILDYAACGLPVVTVAAGEWSDIFRDYDAGVVCAECNPEALLGAIRALKDRKRWTAASENAQRLIREARTWPVVLAPFYEHLSAIEAAKPGRDIPDCRVTRPARDQATATAVAMTPRGEFP